MNNKITDELWGLYVIFKKELFTNIKSVRMVILMILFSAFVLSTVLLGNLMMSYAADYADEDMTGFIIKQGPIFILSMVVGTITAFGPIIALALSFDTIIKEKIQNSIALIMCRPVSRRSIAFGKFFGISGALALPILVVNIVAILYTSFISGKAIAAGQALGFIFITLIFLIIYAAIGQLISSSVKTNTTAILLGVGIWIGLPAVLEIIKYFLSDLSAQLSLLNPGTSYGICVSHALGTLTEGSTGVIPLEGYYITFILWLIIPLILAVEIFNRTDN